MAKAGNQRKPTKQMAQKQEREKQQPMKKAEEPQSSWAAIRSLLSCRHIQTAATHQKHRKGKRSQHSTQAPKNKMKENNDKHYCKKVMCSGSLCNNTKAMHHRSETSASPEAPKKKASSSYCSVGGSSSRSLRALHLHDSNGTVSPACSIYSSSFSPSSRVSSIGGSFRVMPFTRFSGCYECRMVVDPVLGITRDSSLKTPICTCSYCGEIFMKADSLELHQTVKHAVSELGPEDSSKNIVEIIFQSSWLKKQHPICKIDRILKVHNTPKTISKFEEYRDSIKSKASKHPKKNPRCVADGNELLRFHCTTAACSIGVDGSSSLCNSAAVCGVCSVIKNGFRASSAAGKGIMTTATSGRAHDAVTAAEGGKRAMLVCRVIAGRVKKGATQWEGGAGSGSGSGSDECDSVSGIGGVGSPSLDELYVFNPKAILTCFVVIYGEF